MPGLNVLKNGAKGDGVTNDTQAIQNSLNSSLEVRMPPPLVGYKTTSPLILRSGQRIYGGTGPNTQGGSRIMAFNTGHALMAAFALNGTRNIHIDGLYIEDNFSGRNQTNGDAINFDGATDACQVTITNCVTFGFANAITLRSVITSYLRKIEMRSAKANGFQVVGASGLPSTSTQLDALYVNGAGGHGYSFSNMQYGLTVNSCACDQAAGDGYHFDAGLRCTAVTMNSCGCELVGSAGIRINGQSFTINGCSFTPVDRAGCRGMVFENVAQITVNNPQTHSGDYGLYYVGGSLEQTFKGKGIVSVINGGNNTPGAVQVAYVFDPRNVINFFPTL